jgi:hypothetical protein
VDIFDTFEKCTITKRLTKQFEDKKEQNWAKLNHKVTCPLEMQSSFQIEQVFQVYWVAFTAFEKLTLPEKKLK